MRVCRATDDCVKRRRELLSQAEALHLDLAALQKAIAAYVESVKAGGSGVTAATTTAGEEQLLQRTQLAEMYATLQVGRCQPEPIHLAVIASRNGANSISDKDRKRLEKERDKLEMSLSISGPTRPTYLAGSVHADAVTRFVRRQLAKARVRVLNAVLAYEQAATMANQRTPFKCVRAAHAHNAHGAC